MNNKYIENQIKRYQQALVDCEPSADHRERFAERLAHAQTKRTKMYSIIKYCSVAAVWIAIFFAIQPQFNSEKVEVDSLAEVQNYYAMQFENELSSVQKLLYQVDASDREELKMDIKAMQKEILINSRMINQENLDCTISLYSSKIDALKHIQNVLISKY